MAPLGLALLAIVALVAVALRVAREERPDDLDEDVVRRIGGADGEGQSSHVRVLP